MLDLALQLLEEALVVSRPDYQLSTTLPPAEARQFITERECIRRCFWLVQTMCWINGIYTYRPMRPRSVDLMRIVRLPVDEMSFELAKTPEPGEWVSFLMPNGIMMLTPLFLLFRDRAVPVMSLFPFPPPPDLLCPFRLSVCRVLACACPTYKDRVAVWPCVPDVVHVSAATNYPR